MEELVDESCFVQEVVDTEAEPSAKRQKKKDKLHRPACQLGILLVRSSKIASYSLSDLA